jgi:hypothetical protein
MDINELNKRRDERYKAAIARREARPEHQQVISACKASEATGSACLACNTWKARAEKAETATASHALSESLCRDQLGRARSEVEHLIGVLERTQAERDFLATTVERLRESLGRIMTTDESGNSMTWPQIDEMVRPLLASTPPQNLAACKAAALLELQAKVEVQDNGDEVVPWFVVEEMAQNLERTAKGEQASGPGEGDQCDSEPR